MKSFYLLIVFILFNNIIFAQLGYNVAPLNLNNFWVYVENDEYRYKYEVIDTNYYIDTIRYVRVFKSRFPNNPSLHRLREDGFYAYRRDSTYPTINHEQLYYKKDAVAGDYWMQPSPWIGAPDLHYEVKDTHTTMIFGRLTNLKFIHITDSSLISVSQTWTEEFGLLLETETWGTLATLTGCYIDGVVYGDTSLAVSVDDDPFIIHNFKLYQNYPNPFNPATTIEYELQEYAYVNLKVYDVLGNEIAVLVNEEKYAGKYSIKFNGKDLTSGVYFYKLTIGGNTQVRKMILLQ